MTQEPVPTDLPPDDGEEEDEGPHSTVRGPWPKDWMTPFLVTLRVHGNVRHACEAGGVSRITAQNWRMKFPRFKAAWDTCIQEAIDNLEAEAWNRALNNPRADQLLWNMLSSLRREQYGTRVEVDVRVHDRVKELADRYGLKPADVLQEIESIVAGTAVALPPPQPGGASG